MNDKRQVFVAEYLIDMNATQAATRVGYSPQSARQQGQRLLSNAAIKDAIAKAQVKREQKTGVTAAWVLKRLQEEASAGDTDTPNQARIRALELLGKHQRMFANRVEFDLSRLTADELRAAEELRRKMEG